MVKFYVPRRFQLGKTSTIMSACVLASLSGPVQAQSDSPSTVCNGLTVNVTSESSVGNQAVYAYSCGSVSVHVAEGATVTNWTAGGSALISWSRDAGTTVTIDGNVLTSSPDSTALDVYGSLIDVKIGGTGTVFGSYYGSAGDESFSIAPGGKWTTAGMNSFWLGQDNISNAGTVTILGGATFEGLDNFANSGLIILGGGNIDFQGGVALTNAGTIRAYDGNTVLSMGSSTLTNTGQIDLADGTPNDTLQIDGNYAGVNAATVNLDVASEVSDKLIIAGAASGTTTLFVNTSALIPEPMLVVDTVTSEPGAFVLGNTSATPLIDVSLSRIGDDYYVTSFPSEGAMTLMKVATSARGLWYQTLDTARVQSRIGSSKRSRRTPLSLWSQGATGQTGDFGLARQVGEEVASSAARHQGFQAGLDYNFGDSSSIGMSFGYMPGTVERLAVAQGIRTSNSSFSIRGQYAVENGFHVGAIAKIEHNGMQLTNPAFARVDGSPDTSSSGVEVETGFQRKLLGGMVGVDAGLAYLRNNVKGVAVDGLTLKLASDASVRGRVGAHFASNSEGGLFAAAILLHEFAGDEKLQVRQGNRMVSAGTDGASTFARFELGYGSRDHRAAISSWMELGGVKAFGLNARLRFNGGNSE